MRRISIAVDDVIELKLIPSMIVCHIDDLAMCGDGHAFLKNIERCPLCGSEDRIFLSNVLGGKDEVKK